MYLRIDYTTDRPDFFGPCSVQTAQAFLERVSSGYVLKATSETSWDGRTEEESFIAQMIEQLPEGEKVTELPP